jgi:hypothetical protein
LYHAPNRAKKALYRQDVTGVVLSSSGAPFAYKTTNIPVRGLFAGNDCLQDVLASDNPDRVVIDFDGIDDRADVALACVDIAVIAPLCISGRPCSRFGFSDGDRLVRRQGIDHPVCSI